MDVTIKDDQMEVNVINYLGENIYSTVTPILRHSKQPAISMNLYSPQKLFCGIKNLTIFIV